MKIFNIRILTFLSLTIAIPVNAQTYEISLTTPVVGDSIRIDLNHDTQPELIVFHWTERGWYYEAIDSLCVYQTDSSISVPQLIYSRSFCSPAGFPKSELLAYWITDLDQNGAIDILLKTSEIDPLGSNTPIEIIEISYSYTRGWIHQTTLETNGTGFVTDIDSDGEPEIIAGYWWAYSVGAEEGEYKWAAIYKPIPQSGGYRLSNTEFVSILNTKLATVLQAYQDNVGEWNGRKTKRQALNVYNSAVSVLQAQALAPGPSN